MLDQLKSLLGFTSIAADDHLEFDLSSDAYADYDDLFNETISPPKIRRRDIGYIEATWTGIWSRLRLAKYKLQQAIRGASEKIYNGVFYGIAFNLTLFLFARTIGFLAAGSFGWALLTIIPAYIAFLSTGPIYDTVSAFVKFTVPPVLSALKTVAKAIGSRILSHILRVTGIADYAKTVNPGEFFGKVKLPTITVAKDDDVEPNPDLTSNLAVYGPDINLGPFSVGTSIRFNWSLIKYIKHAPQYIKYGLNWIMKKSGLEDFARGVTTPLSDQALREDLLENSMYRNAFFDFMKHIPANPKVEASDREQARNFVQATRPGMSEAQIQAAVDARLAVTHPQMDPDTRLRLAVQKYQEETNDKISSLHKSEQERINKSINENKFPKIISSEQIKEAIKSSQEVQQKFIDSITPKFQKAYQENIEPVAFASLLLDITDVAPSQELNPILEAGLKGIGNINAAFKQFSSGIQSSGDRFIAVFNKKIATYVKDYKPKQAIAQPEAPTPTMLTQYKKPWTKEELQERADKDIAAKKRRDAKTAADNLDISPARRAAMLQEEEETKSRMQQEDELRERGQQTMAGGRTYGKKTNRG